ncbi:hypothetical protein OIV83_000619 [Microbotryomycetes sp. JL201]|nr:hypothetical protein OIV83_000619 [Microbotryomycetes sp. JL201]
MLSRASDDDGDDDDDPHNRTTSMTATMSPINSTVTDQSIEHPSDTTAVRDTELEAERLRRELQDKEAAAKLVRERTQRQAAERAREAAEAAVQAQREFDRRERQKRELEERLRVEQEERETAEAQDRLKREEQRRARELEKADEARRRKDEDERSRRAKLELEKLVAQQRRAAEEKAAEEVQRRKQEQERARLEMNESLQRAKHAGETMLRGHVSAQSSTSIIWRRRYFELDATALKLFKTQTDKDSPVSVFACDNIASVVQDPEESAVPHSVKLCLHDGDYCMVYTDSGLERDWLVSALTIAVTS